MKCIQFGGQGVPWLKEFEKYYKQPKLDKFYSTIISSIEEELPKINNINVVAPEGFHIKQWLNNVDALNTSPYLTRATISLPMIQATQLAHIEYLHQEGYTRQELLKDTKFIVGHSQGIITAAFIAMNHNDSNYYDTLSAYMKLIFYLGIRAQEVYPAIYASDVETQQSEELGTKNPEPMVAVLGESHELIHKLIEEYHQKFPEQSKITIGLFNTPSNRILCSSRASLIEFNNFISTYIQDKKLKFIYLKTSCPFHSSLMKPIVQLVEKDLKENFKFPYTGSDLDIPVYSFFDERNLQHDNHLGISLCKELMLNTLHWDKIGKKIDTDHEIQQIIDLGPGKVSHRLTSDYTAKEIINLTLPKEHKLLLESNKILL